MSSSSFGKHASGATKSQPAVPEPSFAERARTLMHSGRFLIGRICWFVVCGVGVIGCFRYLIGYVLVGNYAAAVTAGVLASLCAFICYAMVCSILERYTK